MRIIYTNSNIGKVGEVRRHFARECFPIMDVFDPSIGVLDVEESGTTLGENAKLKTEAYLGLLSHSREFSNSIVFSDDTGLEIDALDGEPGIFVRRWKDGKTKMTDEEVIQYTLERLDGTPYEKRGARFRTVVALGVLGENGTRVGEVKLFEGVLKGRILEEPLQIREKGFPFFSLFFVDDYGVPLCDVYKCAGRGWSTHRERAMDAVVRHLMMVRA